MKNYIFEYYENVSKKNTLVVKSTTYDKAKNLANKELRLKNTRDIYDWFYIEKYKKYVGVKIYC